MLFKNEHLQGIKQGAVSLAYRKWKRPSVKAGTKLNTSIGQVEIETIERVEIAEIKSQDAKSAGYESLDALLETLATREQGKLYRIKLRYFGADPRIGLRNDDQLDQKDFDRIKSRLDVLDKRSKTGHWTRSILKSIHDHPKLKAVDLAAKAGKEKEWLKINIRKLKNLGLTISHNPGYTLSPRGERFLEMVESSDQ